MNKEQGGAWPMSVSAQTIEVLARDALPDRAARIGARYARYLKAPYLGTPIATFLCVASQIAGLEAVALAIQDDAASVATLAAFGIADLTGVLQGQAEDTMIDAFSKAFGQLDDAVLRGRHLIGTSIEFINCHGVRVDEIVRGLETADLPGICGIDLPPASSLAIFVRD
jgi:hypothetical protein